MGRGHTYCRKHSNVRTSFPCQRFRCENISPFVMFTQDAQADLHAKTLWCCLWAVWTLSLTIVCRRLCSASCAVRPVWTGPQAETFQNVPLFRSEKRPQKTRPDVCFKHQSSFTQDRMRSISQTTGQLLWMEVFTQQIKGFACEPAYAFGMNGALLTVAMWNVETSHPPHWLYTNWRIWVCFT